MSRQSEMDYFLYEMVSQESGGRPTGNGGCLPWILGGVIALGVLSWLMG